MERLFGKVKWFNDSKGVGFIKRVGQSDVFVHYKSIQIDGHKTLRKGQDVSFSLATTEFGVQAIEVRLEGTDLAPSITHDHNDGSASV